MKIDIQRKFMIYGPSIKYFHSTFKFVLISWFTLTFIQCKVENPNQPRDSISSELFVPDGFEVLVVADSVGRARHLAVNDRGDIYVKLMGSDPESGSVVVLRDRDGDGKADTLKRFGGQIGESRLYGAGMTIHKGYLYFGSATKVYRYPIEPDGWIGERAPEVVLDDDHEHGVHWHITKPVSFDNQGNMYIPFGAPSNACQPISATPNGASGGRGIDPCPELEWHGGIWRFDAGKTGLKQTDGERIATGIRSVVAMDWNPEDRHLYVVMHGRDNLYSLFPDRYTPWQSAVLPAEEFLKIEEGSDFGWPYCYYDHLQEKKVLAPEYGGNGLVQGRCANADLPVMGFPGHWAPNDLMFYRGDQFPERYKHGAFIAFHGSTNRAPYPQAGYFVAFIPFVEGKPTGEWEVFADGFTGKDTLVNTSDALYRPMGLAMAPDGSIYITESRKGKIWRIRFTGKKRKFSKRHLLAMEERKKGTHIRTPHEEEDHLQLHLAQGERLYNGFCGTCHQGDGLGAPGRYPPLMGTQWVTGDKKRLIEIVLNGMDGPIEIQGDHYHSVMPAHGFLKDSDIASILTYVRKNLDIIPQESPNRR